VDRREVGNFRSSEQNKLLQEIVEVYEEKYEQLGRDESIDTVKQLLKEVIQPLFQKISSSTALRSFEVKALDTLTSCYSLLTLLSTASLQSFYEGSSL
jgi:uncharacterized membrane protein